MNHGLQEWLDRQFGPVEVVRLGFLHGFMENPWATLGVIAVSLLIFSLIFRYLIYIGVRLSGQTRLTSGHDFTETLCLYLAFGAGFLCGQVFFGNFLLSSLCGGFFVVMCVGAILEGLTVNASHSLASR
jgi:divalent metal cation (Fe/Co/Zn/Cd) transporter